MRRALVVMGVCLLPLTISADQIQDHFTRISEAETFVVDPRTDGHDVMGSYYGPVEVIVDGIWYNTPDEPADAFYAIFDDPPWYSINTLCVGFDGCAWVAECGAQNISTWITFIEDLGTVPVGTVPEYSGANHYHFVADFGQDPEPLTIGTGDGGVYDNSGELLVSLYQLEEGIAVKRTSLSSLKVLY